MGRHQTDVPMGKYQIVWRKKARKQYIDCLIFAYQEYGTKTFYRWIDAVKDMEEHLKENPRSYTIVPELRDMRKEYRGRTIMKNFKFIYYYDERRQTVYIKTIWDLRRNPLQLKAEFR